MSQLEKDKITFGRILLRENEATKKRRDKETELRFLREAEKEAEKMKKHDTGFYI